MFVVLIGKVWDEILPGFFTNNVNMLYAYRNAFIDPEDGDDTIKIIILVILIYVAVKLMY